MKISVGNIYGNLTVISETASKKHYVIYQCICGLKKEIKKYDLLYGNSKSCGLKGCRGHVKRQGFDSTSRMYCIWKSMIARCADKNRTGYENYGGRAITFDLKWQEFKVFYEDMIEGYSDSLTLERINNDGNYSKINCKWATRKEQAHNNTMAKVSWK